MKSIAFKLLIIISTFSLICCQAVKQLIDTDIFSPKVFLNRLLPIPRQEKPSHRFSIQSTDASFELSGKIYQSSTLSNQSQLYNLSLYQQSKSCKYFKSVMQMDSIQGQNLAQRTQQGLKSKSNRLYLIGINDESQDKTRFLKVYDYNLTMFKYDQLVYFNQTALSSSLEDSLFMTEFYDGRVIVTDGNRVYTFLDQLLPNTTTRQITFLQITGLEVLLGTSDQFLGVDSVKLHDKQLLLMLYSNRVVFYEFVQPQKLQKFLLISNPSQSPIQDIQIHPSSSLIYLLSSHHLYIINPQTLSQIVHSLPGQTCQRIYLYHSTIHTICTLEQRNFISEFFYHEELDRLILNRYYNELENYRLVKYVGEYLLMIGENQILIMANGVNRKVIIDMDKQPNMQRFVSFGLEALFLLEDNTKDQLDPLNNQQNSINATQDNVNNQQDNQQDNVNLKNKQENIKNKLKDSININNKINNLGNQADNKQLNHTIMAIGQDFLVLFQLKLVPAQVWCYIQTPPTSLKTNILIVRNTSTCELNARRSSFEGICTNIQPVQIEFQQFQFEHKLTLLYALIVIIGVFIVAVLCLGCVFRENSNYNLMLAQIRAKIQLIKTNNTQLRPI